MIKVFELLLQIYYECILKYNVYEVEIHFFKKLVCAIVVYFVHLTDKRGYCELYFNAHKLHFQFKPINIETFNFAILHFELIKHHFAIDPIKFENIGLSNLVKIVVFHYLQN